MDDHFLMWNEILSTHDEHFLNNKEIQYTINKIEGFLTDDEYMIIF